MHDILIKFHIPENIDVLIFVIVKDIDTANQEGKNMIEIQQTIKFIIKIYFAL